jgi:murein DD-endopeptidase MepM/ murein hydrolase activator NlpD
MPDMKVADSSSVSAASGATNVNLTRQTILGQASRSDPRTSGTSQTAISDIWMLPMTTYTVGAPFGNAGAVDKGVDLLAPEGTPFYAAHGGTVTLARWNGSYGYSVTLNVGNGVQLVYGHASRLLVHEGQHVNSGDLLALTGNTGFAATSAVRFEVRVNGVAVNPISYLNDHAVDLVKHTDSLTTS